MRGSPNATTSSASALRICSIDAMEIALFGGSFDPPHVGHLLAATYVLATEPVGELWLVPVHQHPFGKKLAAPFEHRVELCEALIADAGLRRARVSRVEAELGGEGRTVDLLEHLRDRKSTRLNSSHSQITY